jgi:hypothetical protein
MQGYQAGTGGSRYQHDDRKSDARVAKDASFDVESHSD